MVKEEVMAKGYYYFKKTIDYFEEIK